MTSDTKTTSGRRGRPKDPKREEQMRQALISAANEMLQTMSYRDISIRQLAERAGVNSAMISYHFGSKEGLIISSLKAQLSQAGPSMEQVAELTGKAPSQLLKETITQLIRLYQRQPWIPRMIIDEVATKEGRLRELFIEQIAREKGDMFLMLLQGLKQSGQLREDIDPKLMRVSIISMVAFPFIATPVLDQAFGFSLDDNNIDTWINHTCHLLLEGSLN